MSAATKNTYATLSDGSKMPLIGLGTWKSKPDQVREAVIAAVKAGYRHIDAAYCYENEDEIGEALKELFEEGVVKREDLFITGKLWSIFHEPSRVRRCLELSLKALQLDYIDLFLMHSAMATEYIDDDTMSPTNEEGSLMVADIHYIDTWKAMESTVDAGLAKSIGVSNFSIPQLGEVLEKTRIPCVVNQVENHPLINQKELIDFCKQNDVVVTSYSPLGSPDRQEASSNDPILLTSPLVKEMAAAKKCTPGQLLIAYNLCQELVCIPKSVTPKRIKENLLSLDVILSDDEITKLDSLECNFRAITWEGFENHLHYPF